MIVFSKAKLKYPRGTQYVAESHKGKVYMKRECGIWYTCSDNNPNNFHNPSWSVLYDRFESVSWFICYWYSFRGFSNRSTVRMRKVK